MSLIYAITQGTLDPVSETVLAPPAGFYASAFRVTMQSPTAAFLVRTTSGNGATQRQFGGGATQDSFGPPQNPAYGAAGQKYPPGVEIARLLSVSGTPTFVAEWFG